MTYALPEWLHKRRSEDPALDSCIKQCEERELEIHVMYQSVLSMMYIREEWLMTELSKYGHKFGPTPLNIKEIVIEESPSENGENPV